MINFEEKERKQPTKAEYRNYDSAVRGESR